MSRSLPTTHSVPSHRVLSTGFDSLDSAFGTGGFPRSFLVDVVAREAALPAARQLLLRTVARQQADGRIAYWVDAGQELELPVAAAVGVRAAELLISQPDALEHLFEVLLAVLRSQAIDFVVVDGLEAVATTASAATHSRHLRQLYTAVRRFSASVVFLRTKRDLNDAQRAAGGELVRPYSSIRCEVRRAAPAEGQGGQLALVKVLKNQFAAPFAEALVSVGPEAL